MRIEKLLIMTGLMLVATACSKDDDEDNTPVVNNSDNQEAVLDNSAYKYYGAELYSKETFTYGRFEARMKMASAPGCISSMFLYYNNSYKGNGEVWNEIDIEVLGKSATSFQSNLITGSTSSKKTSEAIHQFGYNATLDYHTYVMEWTPEYILWTVDGVEMRKTEVTADNKKQVAAMVKDQSLRFNLWASSSEAWVGSFQNRYIPIAQYIDYVKVYDYDTATGTFTERWTDDFDTFDSTRWSKGDWDMELVTEKPDNVQVQDGVLILNLTKQLIQ